MNIELFLAIILMWAFLGILVKNIRDYLLEKFSRDWFSDETKINFYNQFVEYLTTDLETGLYKPMKFPIQKIYSLDDYLNLQEEDKIAVHAVMKSFKDLSSVDPDLVILKTDVAKYLEKAKENKQLRGF